MVVTLLVLVLVLLVLVVKSISTSTEETEAPTTAEEFINDATGLDIFPKDED